MVLLARILTSGESFTVAIVLFTVGLLAGFWAARGCDE
jgi:hypothetical protein